MLAEIALPAFPRIHKTLHFAIALPRPFSFRRVCDLADEVGMQPGVLLLPKQKAIGRLSIAPRPSRLLVVLLNALGHRKVDPRSHPRLIQAQRRTDHAPTSS